MHKLTSLLNGPKSIKNPAQLTAKHLQELLYKTNMGDRVNTLTYIPHISSYIELFVLTVPFFFFTGYYSSIILMLNMKVNYSHID